MKLLRNIYILKLLSFFSLCILLLNIVNKGIYTHTHQLSNGEIVIHAHPFNQQDDNTPIKSHHHTSFEYLALSAIDVFNLSVFIFSIVQIIAKTSKKIFYFKNAIQQTYILFKKNKSPPILNSI